MEDRRSSTKRHPERAPARGRVMIHGNRPGRGTILDISATGVRFQLSGAYGPYTKGELLELELRFDGSRGGWLTMRGHIVWLDGGEIAVATDAAAPDLEDWIQAELLAMLEAADGADVLLVDSIPARRARTADSLRAVGRRVSEVATPLDVIDRLGESGCHPRLIAIADTVPSAIADELRAYVRREHPEIGLVRMMAGSR